MKEKVRLFEIGLVRGLIGMILGVLIGLALVSGIRALVGLPVWNPEAAWVVAGVFGTIGFMLMIGVMRDWIKWALGEETPDFPETDPRLQGWAKYLSVSYDHKIIGIQYGVTALIVISLAGLFAIIFRTELIAPGIQFLQPQDYNTIMTLHGIVMIGGMLLGVGAMSNYLVPLLIGANDMAFPRLNAFAYWINVPAVILLVGTLFMGGLETGWTGYPPLSSRAPLGTQWFLLGVYFIGFSSIFGALNIIATVMKLRAKGMTYFRMPIFVWTAAATALIALTATQLIGLSFQLVMFERLFGMAFFETAKGGNPILFQHLFWFYSHPAVYVFVLTGLGVISELLPVFARKPLFGYRWVALSSFGIALVGFLVWAHHMFTSGMEPYLRVPFMYSTLLVAVPTGVKFFSWVATIWEGKLSFETPMLFVLGAISIFLLGGLSGPPNGVVATDLHLQDTYWIVGHFHATMFGGFLFPFLAAIYYWFPKITGRMYNETLGKIHFYLMLPAFYVQSLGQMQVGLLGMRRRIADYDPALQIEFSHLLITVAAYVIGISLIIAFINFAYSAAKGKVVTTNVWRSRSPEWTLLPSPIPAHNYPEPIEVVGEPYDYGVPGAVFVRKASDVPQREERETILPADSAPASAD
ncbi:MAG: cytochrome c oxidase subunit I [Anaerolineales bacterium]